MEHVLQIHDNHSEQLAIHSNDENDLPTYKHVEHMKTSASMMPFTLINETDVSCSPKFNISKLNTFNISVSIVIMRESIRCFCFLLRSSFITIY